MDGPPFRRNTRDGLGARPGGPDPAWISGLAPPFRRARQEVAHGHDIRRTVADALLNRIGAPPWIVDHVVLGHARPKLLRTYMPTLPLGEARDALQKWGDELAAILEPASDLGRALPESLGQGHEAVDLPQTLRLRAARPWPAVLSAGRSLGTDPLRRS